MGQIFRMKLSENARLLPYEEKILRRYGGELTLPLSFVHDENGDYIDYLVDGHVSFENYQFSGIESVFSVLRSLVEANISIQRHLLNPSRFFSEKEMILVSCERGRAVPLFGKERINELPGFEEEANLILPIVIELSKLNEVACAKEAMESVYNKIRGKNPGFREILSIVRDSQREWNLILPSSF